MYINYNKLWGYMSKINYNKILDLKEKINQLNPEELDILVGLINQEISDMNLKNTPDIFTTRKNKTKLTKDIFPQSISKDKTLFKEDIEIFKKDLITFMNKMFKSGSEKNILFEENDIKQTEKGYELMLDIKVKPGYINIQPRTGVFLRVLFLYDKNNNILYKYIGDNGNEIITSKIFKDYMSFFGDLSEFILKRIDK